MKKSISLILLILFSVFTLSARQVRLLTIGNSFSQDAVENYLSDFYADNPEFVAKYNAKAKEVIERFETVNDI